MKLNSLFANLRSLAALSHSFMMGHGLLTIVILCMLAFFSLVETRSDKSLSHEIRLETNDHRSQLHEVPKKNVTSKYNAMLNKYPKLQKKELWKNIFDSKLKRIPRHVDEVQSQGRFKRSKAVQNPLRTRTIGQLNSPLQQRLPHQKKGKSPSRRKRFNVAKRVEIPDKKEKCECDDGTEEEQGGSHDFSSSILFDMKDAPDKSNVKDITGIPSAEPWIQKEQSDAKVAEEVTEESWFQDAFTSNGEVSEALTEVSQFQDTFPTDTVVTDEPTEEQWLQDASSSETQVTEEQTDAPWSDASESEATDEITEPAWSQDTPTETEVTEKVTEDLWVKEPSLDGDKAEEPLWGSEDNNKVTVTPSSDYWSNNSPCSCVPIMQCAVTYRTDLKLQESPCGEDEVCCNTATSSIPVSSPEFTCGMSKPDHTIKGSEGGRNRASYGEFPWTVLLTLRDSAVAVEHFRCAGTLIHPQVILTAANCLSNIESLNIEAGAWDLKHPLAVQSRTVDKAIIHTSFRSGVTLNYNLALIRVNAPFELNDNVNTICLGDNFNAVDLTQCVANGWGVEKSSGSKGSAGKMPTVMKKIQLPFVPRESCQNLVQKNVFGTSFRLSKGLICAGGQIDSDMCQGDGGGPLMCPSRVGGAMTQIGVVAGGIGCGRRDVPGFYGDVIHYNAWIHENLNNLNVN